MKVNNVDRKGFIEINHARVHNLKNISLAIPRNRLVVITGVSGSGKSSLAFDTLYAEGQRRYVESLSAYARQFLGRIDKPDVDSIKGIPPAIAIEQKVNTRNPRSTVGTSTEIYDYLKLLFARAGKIISPVSGNEVKRHHVSDLVDFINSHAPGTKIAILAPICSSHGENKHGYLETLSQQGFSRVEHNGQILPIDDIKAKSITPDETLNLLIDRVTVNPSDEDNNTRLADSIQTAFNEGKGECLVKIFDTDPATSKLFTNRLEADGIIFEEPSEHLFTFNSPLGACPVCEGFGKITGIDPGLVIPNKNLSVFDDAIACWKGETMGEWKSMLVKVAHKFNFPVHTPYYQLTTAQKEVLWTGNQHFSGLNDFFSQLEEKLYKIQNRVMLARYRGKTTCTDCNGTRLRKESSYVRIAGKTIHELVKLPISHLSTFINEIKLPEHDLKVAKRLLIEIRTRVSFLNQVGLGYLTLDRLSSTLSGGESQRVNLTTSLGNSLVGSLYILDEPSIGLHPRDTKLLTGILKNLQKLGNTVIVVEHDEEVIRACDEIIDIGPGAGQHGGNVVFQGEVSQITSSPESLTTKYLTGVLKIELPPSRRVFNNYIKLVGVRENNLKNVTVKIPLNVFTVVTGVSGSGKSSLVKKVLYPALKKVKGGSADITGEHDLLEGNLNAISDVELVDQDPIGRSSRSNPATYLKAWDEIRKLLSEQKKAKLEDFKPSHFSFNVEGGRCEECQGEGTIKVEMQFMADLVITCESCQGKRFKPEILDITYKGKNVFDILDMTVEEAILFFSEGKDAIEKRVVNRLQPLANVGLEYVRLGQSSGTLSGGESQRIKLASFLAIEKNAPALFIFDEPTTGLHIHDINKLLKSFNALIERGHTILVVEHNMEVIKTADHVIDLGPEGGENGGYVVHEGTPEALVKNRESHTGRYLEPYLKKNGRGK